MNFEQIKKKYPKSWEKWIDYFHCHNKDYHHLLQFFTDNKRLLYETESLSGWLFRFFDEQGMIIIISYDSYGGKYYWKIYHSTAVEGESFWSSRQEAEQAAFTKTFEILEET